MLLLHSEKFKGVGNIDYDVQHFSHTLSKGFSEEATFASSIENL